MARGTFKHVELRERVATKRHMARVRERAQRKARLIPELQAQALEVPERA